MPSVFALSRPLVDDNLDYTPQRGHPCELTPNSNQGLVEIHRTGFVFSRDQKMKPRYTMGCGPSSEPADPADARETSG